MLFYHKQYAHCFGRLGIINVEQVLEKRQAKKKKLSFIPHGWVAIKHVETPVIKPPPGLWYFQETWHCMKLHKFSFVFCRLHFYWSACPKRRWPWSWICPSEVCCRLSVCLTIWFLSSCLVLIGCPRAFARWFQLEMSQYFSQASSQGDRSSCYETYPTRLHWQEERTVQALILQCNAGLFIVAPLGDETIAVMNF